mmetsp:Transcript_75636/g.225470  ORF Transcript_75636/g.225470 Transcript_75636/m.225470 type:complete len:261 (-) Transcript_75636:1752-2534(-)
MPAVGQHCAALMSAAPDRQTTEPRVQVTSARGHVAGAARCRRRRVAPAPLSTAGHGAVACQPPRLEGSPPAGPRRRLSAPRGPRRPGRRARQPQRLAEGHAALGSLVGDLALGRGLRRACVAVSGGKSVLRGGAARKVSRGRLLQGAPRGGWRRDVCPSHAAGLATSAEPLARRHPLQGRVAAAQVASARAARPVAEQQLGLVAAAAADHADDRPQLRLTATVAPELAEVAEPVADGHLTQRRLAASEVTGSGAAKPVAK